MRINLGNTPLFRGMTVPDIEEMLRCLRAAERTYKKGAVILPEGTPVHQGMKSGDVDPRCRPEYCTTASDKALAVGGGVLEAILHLSGALRTGMAKL